MRYTSDIRLSAAFAPTPHVWHPKVRLKATLRKMLLKRQYLRVVIAQYVEKLLPPFMIDGIGSP
jgi:hypothetical protein